MSKKRPYRVTNRNTGTTQMVLATSKAQAISYIGRNLFAVAAASGMEVANHSLAGLPIEDATTTQDEDGEDGEEHR